MTARATWCAGCGTVRKLGAVDPETVRDLVIDICPACIAVGWKLVVPPGTPVAPTESPAGTDFSGPVEYPYAREDSEPSAPPEGLADAGW